MRVRFQKSATSKHWKILEDKFPGARLIMQDIMTILKLINHEDAYIDRDNIRKGETSYTITEGYRKDMLTIYLRNDKPSNIYFYPHGTRSIEITNTEDLEKILRDWAVNL